MKKVVWTHHAKGKMRYYGLSESRVKRVIHSPKRLEEGIAEDTIAAVQAAGSLRHPHEIWVMFVEQKNERRIISAWRYPGVTKPGESLPEEMKRELAEARYAVHTI